MTNISENFSTAKEDLLRRLRKPLRLHKTTQDNSRPLRAICILFMLQKCGFNRVLDLQDMGDS